MHNFHTTIGVFIIILLAYLALTLALGAKRVYFEPFIEKPDPAKEKPDTAASDKDEKS